MDEVRKPILVPWDFSQVAEYALQHAVKYAKLTDNDVTFVHVVKKAKEIDEAKDKLNLLAEETMQKYRINKPNVVVVEGSIFDEITRVADEISAILVVMGTHGIRGIQKFTGSWALKVITGTKAPFVVVQSAPEETEMKDILFPVDFKSEDTEKLVWANYLSNYYKMRLHLCYKVTNDAIMKKKIQTNLALAKKYLSEKQIDYVVKAFEGGGNLAEETIKYAKETSASMILIMTTKNLSLQDYILGASEQQIIANEGRIPVMCVNPRPDLRKFGGFN